MAKITLRTTEIIGGEKKTAGDVVELDESDPVAVKTRALEAAEQAPQADAPATEQPA